MNVWLKRVEVEKMVILNIIRNRIQVISNSWTTGIKLV